jgi:peptidyl-prolyl isomerase G (cyclophilin G)
VFGQVVGGKEVIKEIEDLDVDKKDRPLQDARIVNCGQLVRKEGAKRKEAKKKRNK